MGEERYLRSISWKIQGRILIDVGAHHGSYCNYLSKLSPQSTIYAFEPHPKSIQILKSRLISPRIRVINKAVGEIAEPVELYDFADSDGSTQASMSKEAVQFFEPIVVAHSVDCTTLDDFITAEGLDEIALLKVDAEGFDLAVLRGAKRTLAQKRIETIQFEFIPGNVITRTMMRDFFEVLEGYEIFRICLNGQLMALSPYDAKRCEIFVQQNLIAIRVDSDVAEHANWGARSSVRKSG